MSTRCSQTAAFNQGLSFRDAVTFIRQRPDRLAGSDLPFFPEERSFCRAPGVWGPMVSRCRGNKPSGRSTGSDCSRGGSCQARCFLSDRETVRHAHTDWPPDVKQGREAVHQRSFLDALLSENILLTVLLFLEAADATRFGACCSDLQLALRAPRVQPLWRQWFEKSGFVWWPYGGVCGAACRLEVDRDGFVVQTQPHQPKELKGGERPQPSTGYKQFRHEGWCCQFLWNARVWDRWKRGRYACAALPTDSHKLFMVSVHPKGVHASRAEVVTRPPAADDSEQPSKQAQRGTIIEELQQQGHSQASAGDQSDLASALHHPFRCGSSPSVHFSPGAGCCLLHALHEKAAVLTAASDRVLCLLEPLARVNPTNVKLQESPSAAVCGLVKPPKESFSGSQSPRATYASGSSFSSLETLELELESLVSGGSSRKGSGKSRRNANYRHGGGAGWGETRTSTGHGLSGGSKGAASRAAAASATCSSSAPPSAEHQCLPAATAPPPSVASAAEVKEICRCGPRTSWLGCSVDAASGLMACCLASSEQSSTGKRRKKKGGPGFGVADACEYRVFDIITESVSVPVFESRRILIYRLPQLSIASWNFTLYASI